MSRPKGSPVSRDVIVIGAGASGLFCAIECGKRGRSVLVLDHADRICSKVLVSGGGRCNFTNLDVSDEHYLSANPHFCRSALARFTPADLLALLARHGIAWFEKEAGQLFCIRGSREIAAMLRSESDAAGVEIKLNCRIAGVKRDRRFVLATSQGTFRSESLVIAAGGLSRRDLGATGLGYALAKQFGLAVTELKPGLVPLVFSSKDQKRFCGLAGISLDAVVHCAGRRFAGGILFTHRGLSGPAILQVSSCWSKGAALLIDLLPDLNPGAALAGERSSRMELKTLLGRWFPRRFAETWCGLYAPSRPVNQYSDQALRSIDALLHAWEITPQGTEGYERAEVTVGGIDTREVSSKTMEALAMPGLYCIGEALDVTGHLGGYNLHWAWASGSAAGRNA